MPGIQRRRDGQALRGATAEPHVQCNAILLDNGYVLDQQTNHPLPFPVGQSRVLPDLPKVSRQSKNLLPSHLVRDEMV